jgi:serine phosphatase RsbU (regulator of sigma subunit)
MVPDNSKLIKETEIPFQKDDIIILYTDGLTEGRNMKGEMYTMENLIKAIELYGGRKQQKDW